MTALLLVAAALVAFALLVIAAVHLPAWRRRARRIPGRPPVEPRRLLPPPAPRHRRTDASPRGVTATGVIRRIDPTMLPERSRR